jgi:hypothetical protein
MLATLPRLLGIVLQQHVSGLMTEVTKQTSARIRRQVQSIGITLGFAFAGLIAGLATVAIGLAAIFVLVDREHGPLIGLTVIGAITAVLAGLTFTLAATYARMRAPRKPIEPSTPPSPDRVGAVQPRPGDADPFDAVRHRIAAHTAAAGDAAIDAVTEFVRSGSREALVGSVALAVVVGIVIGRKK